jgi:hypothetical protein
MEIAQAAAAILAMFFAAWQVYDAMRDASAQKAAKDRRASRQILALDRQLSEFARLVVVVIFVGIGLLSLVLPPPSAEHVDATGELLQPFTTRVGLLLATLVLMIDGARARRARRAYMGTITDDDHDPGASGLKKIEQEVSAIEENVATIDETVKAMKQADHD